MKESKIEHYLDAEVRRRRGQTRKVVYQGRTGAPDRWCFLPGGYLLIVELKAPGEKPRPDQQAELEWLMKMGARAAWVDSKEGVDKLMREYDQAFDMGA